MRARFVSVIAAAALALPLSAATIAPAQAVTLHRLTVRVIDRNGHAATDAQVQVFGVHSAVSAFMKTGGHRALRAGIYNLAVWITTGTSPNQSFTLADKVINLNRDRTVVLDARKGLKVRLRLDNPSAQAETLEVAPIVNGNWAFNPWYFDNEPPGLTYAVPMRSKFMRLYIYSVWEKKGTTPANPSPFRYDIVKVYRGGIPASPVTSAHTARLARVQVTVRATNANEKAWLGVAPRRGVNPAAEPPLAGSTYLGSTPAHVLSYRTPGYQWSPSVYWQSPSVTLQDENLNQNPYGLGLHRELWGSAVFAPAADSVFAVQDVGRTMIAGMVESDFPISDALHQTDSGTGVTKTWHLYQAGRLLAQSHRMEFHVRVPTWDKQFRLTLHTERAAGALLSTRVSATWRFFANRGYGVIYGVRLLPAGLDLRNRAAAGSLTKVALRVDGVETSNAVFLPTAKAWASSNDGTTWHRVTVRRSGNHYVLSVRNASAVGFTSLRVFVADGHGNSENLTVIHAYRVR
ncbi:MAG TPA: hypothetical protein VEV61_17505 [Streptosporangiaceae bacterium]|nr:hypothetical protein [Streptosporangiaceae bacterium]